MHLFVDLWYRHLKQEICVCIKNTLVNIFNLFGLFLHLYKLGKYLCVLWKNIFVERLVYTEISK